MIHLTANQHTEVRAMNYSTTPADMDKFDLAIKKMLAESVPLDHAHAIPARCYLANEVGMLNEYPDALRFHPALPYHTTTTGKCLGTYPALLAKVTDREGEVVTTLRLYLTPEGERHPIRDGWKLSRPARSEALPGSAVRLFPINDEMIIVDSIEEGMRLHLELDASVWVSPSKFYLTTTQTPEHVQSVQRVTRKPRT